MVGLRRPARSRSRDLATGCGIALQLAVMGCSGARVESDQQHPTLTFPVRVESTADAGAPGKATAPSGKKRAATAAGFAPDPLPLRTADQWQLLLSYKHGTIHLDEAKAVHLDEAVSTPRHMGRFAFELWIGHELIDRARFDFPLLAGEVPPTTSRRELHPKPLFGPGAEVTRAILIPASTRATRAQVVDRATGEITPMPWPPANPDASTKPHETTDSK